jgi:N-acetylmuramoyl-L-alanine amidase
MDTNSLILASMQASVVLPALFLMAGLFVIYIQHMSIEEAKARLEAQPEVSGVTLEPLAAGTLSNRKIVIDPGHGDHDSGATNGPAIEKNVNLSVALKLTDMLRARGATVIMTRDDDTFVALDERAAISNRSQCDIFVSVHTNANDNANVHGIETYYYSDESETLARTMFDALVGWLGDKPNYVHQRTLRVLSQNKRIAVLCEHGYLSFVPTRDLLVQEEYQQRIAESLCAGIEKYFHDHPVA